jgi:DNA-binding phage protein
MEVIILEPTNYTGSVDFEDEDVLSLDDEYVQAKIAFQKAQASADAFRERQHALAKQMEEDEQNLTILLEDGDNIAGEVSRRLQHIITAKGWERTALAQASGIGRTTLYRYLLSPGDERYQITKKKNLLKILDVLSVSVHAFCVFPDNFETWRKSFDQTPVNGLSLFDWRDEVLCILQTNTFVYQQNGHNVRMPQAQFEMFKNAIEGILGMLDMLPHDTHSNWPGQMSSSKK